MPATEVPVDQAVRPAPKASAASAWPARTAGVRVRPAADGSHAAAEATDQRANSRQPRASSTSANTPGAGNCRRIDGQVASSLSGAATSSPPAMPAANARPGRAPVGSGVPVTRDTRVCRHRPVPTTVTVSAPSSAEASNRPCSRSPPSRLVVMVLRYGSETPTVTPAASASTAPARSSASGRRTTSARSPLVGCSRSSRHQARRAGPSGPPAGGSRSGNACGWKGGSVRSGPATDARTSAWCSRARITAARTSQSRATATASRHPTGHNRAGVRTATNASSGTATTSTNAQPLSSARTVRSTSRLRRWASSCRTTARSASRPSSLVSCSSPRLRRTW
nr:hypothetical protein [Micromonospora sp. DH13]